MVYYCFIIPFPVGCGVPYFNLPHMTIYDSPRPKTISHYTPDLFPASIPVASENFIITLTTPFDSPKYNLLTSYYPNIDNIIMSDEYDGGNVKTGCSSRTHYRTGFLK